jgi:hypothetical protein
MWRYNRKSRERKILFPVIARSVNYESTKVTRLGELSLNIFAHWAIVYIGTLASFLEN